MDIFDTGILTAFDGTGGTALMAGEWNTRHLNETPNGDLCEGLIEVPPPEAIVHPMSGGSGDFPWDGGEGIVIVIEDLVDIGEIEGEFNYYSLVVR